MDLSQTIEFLIISTQDYLTGTVAQDNHPLEWIYTKHYFRKTLMMYKYIVPALIQQIDCTADILQALILITL